MNRRKQYAGENECLRTYVVLHSTSANTFRVPNTSVLKQQFVNMYPFPEGYYLYKKEVFFNLKEQRIPFGGRFYRLWLSALDGMDF